MITSVGLMKPVKLSWLLLLVKLVLPLLLLLKVTPGLLALMLGKATPALTELNKLGENKSRILFCFVSCFCLDMMSVEWT